MYNILIWSPTTGWYTTNYSPHYYLFKTHYKHYGKFADNVNWMSYGDITATEAIEQVRVKQPNLVLLGIYPWNRKEILNFCELLEQEFPTIPVFLGGIELNFHDTSMLDKYNNVIGIIQGEGEVPNTLIVDAYCTTGLYDNIPGVWIRHKGKYLKPDRESPRIKFKGGIGPKDGNFFEIDYSWLIENADDIFKDIKTNYNLDTQKNNGLRYFFWESAKGCPYGCVYCDWGGGINTKVRRKPKHIIEQELDLIFKNLDNLFLHVVDANFGIFPQDIETAECIAELIRKYNKVGKVDLSITFAKNNQDNVAHIIEILTPVKSQMPWSLDLQTTDQGVLDDIKRTQAPIEYISQKYKLKENRSKFYTNVMLGLPGTNIEKDFKSWCDVLDAGSQVNGYITTIPPQAIMLSPEFIEEWDVKTFRTHWEHATLNHLNYYTQDSAEIIYMHSCKSFSTEMYIDTLMLHEQIQLLDGCYITKFARILANKNNYGAFDFYKLIVEKFFVDEKWLGVNINDIRLSIRDWIFNDKPFGHINGKVFTEVLMQNLIISYYLRNLKQELLNFVGHMHPQIENALDIGFRTLPVGKKNDYKFETKLKYSSTPICELTESATTNTIVVNPNLFSKNSIKQVAGRMMSPESMDWIISNYRP